VEVAQLSSGTRECDRRSHTMQRERSAIHDQSAHQQYESGVEWTGVKWSGVEWSGEEGAGQRHEESSEDEEHSEVHAVLR
jgi:hypothetical protein